MSKTIFTLLFVMALLLSACAQAAQANPTEPVRVPTKSESDAAYPYPASDSPAPAAPAASNPYPDANQPAGTDPSMTNEQRFTQRRLNSQLAPQEADAKLVVGPAYVEIENSQLMIAESDPAQVSLHLVGNVPNPCYSLRVLVHEPSEEGQIMVEVYSVADPEKVCADMLQPFDETIKVENLSAGKYTILVNEFELGPDRKSVV